MIVGEQLTKEGSLKNKSNTKEFKFTSALN